MPIVHVVTSVTNLVQHEYLNDYSDAEEGTDEAGEDPEEMDDDNIEWGDEDKEYNVRIRRWGVLHGQWLSKIAVRLLN